MCYMYSDACTYVYRANLFIVGNMLINRRALKQNDSVGEKHLKYTGLLCYMEDFGMGRTYWTHESEYI